MIAGMAAPSGRHGKLRRDHMAGPVIHTYRAAEHGLFVNSYLVEAEAGVVAVDTGLLVSDIEALRARLQALHKPLLAILVTHPHPDHFVRRLSGGGATVPPSARAELDRAMQAFLPGVPLAWMIGLGADTVAGELAAADRAAREH
jgi:glyoxylase-like metal-dependent hydrolase (beta-lactamase superfamily II)